MGSTPSLRTKNYVGESQRERDRAICLRPVKSWISHTISSGLACSKGATVPCKHCVEGSIPSWSTKIRGSFLWSIGLVTNRGSIPQCSPTSCEVARASRDGCGPTRGVRVPASPQFITQFRWVLRYQKPCTIARWPRGEAGDCKSLYTSSNLVRVSMPV